REHGVRADVTVSLRLDPRPYDLVHVVSLFQPDHAQTIANWGKKTVVTPIWWDGPRVQWVTNVLPHILAPERSDEERENLLKPFARRSLEAGGQPIDRASFDDSGTAALASVRNLADRIVATGPEEMVEMERSLGDTEIPADSVTLGLDPALFASAS